MKEVNQRKVNRGSTLLLVVVAIAFIGVLSSVVITMSMINIQMKSIDKQSKENFYTAEEVMQEVKGGLEEIAAKALEDAYQNVLTNYVSYTSSGICISDKFDEEYLQNLSMAITSGPAYSYYDANKIKDHMSPGAKSLFITTCGALECELSSSLLGPQKYVRLYGVKVKYKNENTGQLTTIDTNITIHSPGMAFSTSTVYPEFSKYAIIADNQLATQAANVDSTIEGDVYSGAGGILACNGTMTINGSTLVTRGNIKALNDTKLYIGDLARRPSIYAENIETSSDGAANSNEALLKIIGRCYVSNDLALNAVNSNVSISGNYVGFSYNETNEVSPVNPDQSRYSSAIVINGKNSALDLSGLSTLLLAGHTYISRSNEVATGGGLTIPDIMMGQSIGVKTNQTMYLVQDEYIRNGMHNPMTQSEFDSLTAGSRLGVDAIDPAKIPGSPLDGKIDTAVMATPYFYQLVSGGVNIVYLYWSFASQEAANDYFDWYINDSTSNEVNYKAFCNQMSTYLKEPGVKIKLNDSMIIKNAGSLFQFKDGKYQKTAELGANPFANADVPAAAILDSLCSIAYNYRERQLNLKVASSSGPNIRLDNKTDNPLFKTIISQDSGQSVIHNEAIAASSGAYGFPDAGAKVKTVTLDLDSNSSDYEAYVIIVDNPTSTYYLSSIPSAPIAGDYHALKTSDYRGIIIATGDVDVDVNFKGLIISGGNVTMDNHTVAADIDLVRSILDYGINNYYTMPPQQKYIHYFKQFETGVGSKTGMSGTVNIATSIEYENWVKNAD